MSSATRVAVVTGSNKGIGLAIVRELCKHFDGVVYLTSREEVRGKAAVEELNKEGLHPLFHQLDIDDGESVIKLRDHLLHKYGGLDVLINNAAILLEWHLTTNSEPFGEIAARTLKTNFFSTLAACNILFPILKPHGRVVNMSSSAGHLSEISGEEPAATELRNKLASPDLSIGELCGLVKDFIRLAHAGEHGKFGWPPKDYVSYKVSKVAVSALTRIQQREFDRDPREDIIVNSVHPGYVVTDMTKGTGQLTVEQGASAPSWLALLPSNVTEPKGAYIWYDKQVVDWINGPKPAPY